MECHMEQMLYRDQRTIKTRYHHRNNHHQPLFLQQCCSSLENNVRTLLKNCSLDCNCHTQYFLKLRRLRNQTEVRCGYEERNFASQECGKRIVLRKWWLKKLQDVLLLSVYLSLITFPYVSAVPTTISSRELLSLDIKLHPKLTQQQKMNTTVLTNAYRSAKSSLDRARDLKEKFKQKSYPNNPEELYKDIPLYPFLQLVPQDKKDMENQLQDLELSKAMIDLHKYVQIVKIAIEQLEKDYANDQIFNHNISSMRGSLDNIIEELITYLDVNNLEGINIDESIMDDNIKGGLDQGDRAIRDWLFIKALYQVLDYAILVFRHFKISL